MACVEVTDIVAYLGVAGSLHFDFSSRLQSRGTDFKVYTNTGYVKDEHDSEVLANIMGRLVGKHPIEVIDVRPYGLQVHYNRAANPRRIVAAVREVARFNSCIGFRDETTTD